MMPCNNQPQSLVSFSNQNYFSCCVCHLGHTFRLGSAVWFFFKLPVQVSWAGEWLSSLCPCFVLFLFLKEQYLLRDPLPSLLAECLESKRKHRESLQVSSGIWQGICSKWQSQKLPEPGWAPVSWGEHKRHPG